MRRSVFTAAILGGMAAGCGSDRTTAPTPTSTLDVTQGFGYAMWLHRDIDFEGLRDYRPFTDMLASSQ
jgi:hypothetical protein